MSSDLPPRDSEMDALAEIFADLGFVKQPKVVHLERDEAEIARQRREYWNWTDLYTPAYQKDPIRFLGEGGHWLLGEDLPEEPEEK